MPKQPLYPMEWWESHKDEMIKLGQTGFGKKYGIGRQTVFNYWHKMGLPTERQRNKKPEWWKAHRDEVIKLSPWDFRKKYESEGITSQGLRYWREKFGAINPEISKRIAKSKKHGRKWWEEHLHDLTLLRPKEFEAKYHISSNSVYFWRVVLGITKKKHEYMPHKIICPHCKKEITREELDIMLSGSR